ncbi:MAG: enoyl-CoA hydratase-related protein [Myxococcota bacterium]|nr:enoyl-CoA hydratase-related protein [Myxococcota bacterium]
MPSPTLLVRNVGHVRCLTFNRPERRNALNAQGWTDLADALEAAMADRSVRAVVLTGAGAAFCAGQDLSEMTALPDPSTPHPFSHCMDVLCRFDKVLIAAVNGAGVGGGLTILLHCDVVLMSDSARLKAPFVQLGVVPEAGSSYLLPLICGHRGAAEVLYGADWVTAERAVALSLATARCAPDDLLSTAMARAAHVASHAPESLRHTKRLVLATRAAQLAAARAREDAAFAVRVGSPENIEAITAFFERRKPNFEG